jgi:hypothetical protein
MFTVNILNTVNASKGINPDGDVTVFGGHPNAIVGNDATIDVVLVWSESRCPKMGVDIPNVEEPLIFTYPERKIGEMGRGREKG